MPTLLSPLEKYPQETQDYVSLFQVSRHSVRVGSGITRLSWPGDGGRRDAVLAATLDGLVRLVDVRRGNVVADCSGHSAAVLDMAVAK